MQPLNDLQVWLEISIGQQVCRLWQADQVIFQAPVSTALNGPGEQNNSGCTPRGWHTIRACISGLAPINSVFRGRRPTGEIYSAELAQQFPNRDWILTRILWLSGLEVGRNRLGNVDTMQRYIYIHGTPDSEPMGEPKSHGCIRMRNADVIALFDRVSAGTAVLIQE
jgi:L,D-transpeptidase YbiS